MIFTERTIRISNNECKMDNTVVLYRGDKNVEIRFTLIDCPFKYSSKDTTNIIESTEASYAQLVIKVPNNRNPIFSDITATKRGAVIFTVTEEMIDEAGEVGDYTFQIRLFDENKQSRGTIPEVKDGIEIREPIATEDISNTNEVNVATVGYAITTGATPEEAFDGEGNYNKTTWGTGDRITDAKLNKIEAAIDGVNKKVVSGSTSGSGNNPSTGNAITLGNYIIQYNETDDTLDFIYTGTTTEDGVITPTWIPNTNIGVSGTVSSDDLAMVTDFIPIESGYTYTINLTSTSSTKITFWDSSKTFISRSGDYSPTGTDVTITFPSNNTAAYFRVKTDENGTVTRNNVNEYVIIKKVAQS